jgi:NDP-sugar pyrophosphorylase family protein
MPTKPTLLVLAAGMGSRYGGLKQIDPVGPANETIIDYSIYDALRAGFGKIVFVIRHDIEHAFREAIGRKFEKHAPVDYVFQELDKVPAGFGVPKSRTKPWGTSHAILMAKNVIHEPFAAINADDFYGATSYKILHDQLASGSSDHAMVGFVLRNTLSEHGSVSRGVCSCDSNSYLQSIAELTKIEKAGNGAKYSDESGKIQHLSGDEIVSMNCWGFRPSLFAHLREQFANFLREQGHEDKSEFFIPAAVNSLVNSGKARLKVLRTPDSWFGVTYREDKPHVVASIRALVARGDYPGKLWT